MFDITRAALVHYVCVNSTAAIQSSADCEAAFNALQSQLPGDPVPKWNSCCDPATNLPYGCTLRAGDNDFIYNSNAASPV